jgi:hypothetical protein
MYGQRVHVSVLAPCEVCYLQNVYSSHPDWAGAILGAAGCIQHAH